MSKKLDDKELEKITGGVLGMSNPVAGMSREQAEEIALSLGPGKDMGSYTTMSGDQFMKWWASVNGIKEE